uniref:Reverse transcriptase n=1 Tax=Tanacetum cinerariifolium TaxID=118510 RepID=A0A6L2K0M6_TANCI|nr:reverse transcriptase [Tanacetum cinerariifolium]GEU62797.1 reverse transcriptase [Tanacetum cinerariifolium]
MVTGSSIGRDKKKGDGLLANASLGSLVLGFPSTSPIIVTARVGPLLGKSSRDGFFSLIQHADPTKVGIGEREVREGKVLLLELTRGCVIPLDWVNDQGGVDVQGVGDDDVDAETQALVVDKSKIVRKRKTVDGASGFGLPPREHEDGGHADSVSTANLRTRRLAERFIISIDTPHDSSANAAYEKVSLVVRFIVLNPAVLTTSIATTVVAGTSVLLPRGGDEPACARPDVAGPSQPTDTDPTKDSFYVSLDMDSKTSHQTYLLTEFNVGSAHQTCLGAKVRMQIDHVLRGKKRLEGKFGVQANLLKERDAEIVDLKARLSLREDAIAKAIHLRGRIANVEAAKAARAGELESFKEQNVALKGRVTALEFAVIAKDSEVAKLTHELSSLQLSCNDLSIKASTLDCEKDKLIDQVSELEATCFGLRDEVVGYKLLKEQAEVVQDEHVKALSDRVASIDSGLIDMALYIDEEFYPRYLTTITRRKWILSHGLKLAVTKCLQSPKYLSSLGGTLGRAIDKGMKDGLAADIDYGRAGRGLDDIAAYVPSAEVNFVFAIHALCVMNFLLLAQLESQKDASMADIVDLLCLEGLAAETPKASQLQPLPGQLMVPIHQLEDQVIIRETSLSFSLDVAHVRTRIRGDTVARRLSLTDAMVSLLEPLSAKSLTGEASTFGFPATTTALSTTFVQASTIPPAPSAEVPPSLKIVFEQQEAKLSALFCKAGLIALVYEISRSRFISKASSFCTMSISAVLMVGMPISAGITAFVSYVTYLPDLCCTAIGFSFSVKSVSSVRASAFLFSLLGTCLIENFMKLLESTFTFYRPTIRASYSASLLVVSNLNLRANSSSASMGMSRESSSRCSTMKYAKIYPLTDVLGLYSSAFAVHWKSLFFVHFFKVLKNDNDFSADLERNLFRLSSFPFNFCTYFRHFGDGRFKTASTLSGRTIILSVFTFYPRNVPSSIPKRQGDGWICFGDFNEILYAFEKLRERGCNTNEMIDFCHACNICNMDDMKGDKNTRYFHTRAISQNKRNSILRLKDEDGKWADNEDGVCDLVSAYFSNLFSSSSPQDCDYVVEAVDQSLTGNDILLHEKHVKAKEVYDALMQMASTKAPGPDAGHMTSARGLRQGDLISPYLFIMYAKALSSMIRKSITQGCIHGIIMCRGALAISHLFFADDSIFFLRASSADVINLKNILENFLMILYGLWTRRNKIFHGQLNKKDVNVEVMSKFLLMDFHKANQQQPTTTRTKATVRWTKPNGDYIKFNYNASWQKEFGRVGLGFVAQNACGDVLLSGARTEWYASSPLEAEAKSLLWATNQAHNKGYSKIIFESDSLCLVNVL